MVKNNFPIKQANKIGTKSFTPIHKKYGFAGIICLRPKIKFRFFLPPSLGLTLQAGKHQFHSILPPVTLLKQKRAVWVFNFIPELPNII
jgi:hypothetical protein